MPTLKLYIKNKPIRDFEIGAGATLTIGRRENNDVALDDPAVSGRHAEIESLGERFVLIDLKSKNGSYVNERRVDAHWLKHGDAINIGDYVLVFEHEQKASNPAKTPEDYDDTLAMSSSRHREMMKKSTPHKSINVVGFWDVKQGRGTVRDADPQTSRPAVHRLQDETGVTLTYLTGGNGDIKLTRNITTIGKHPTSDIVVKGLLLNPTSATISKAVDGFYFNYIGGLPKPKINDVTASDSTLLTDADIIEIGAVRLQFSSLKL